MLSFADTKMIDRDILEVEPQRNVEVTQRMIGELDDLIGRPDIPGLVLINNINHNSFTFEGILAARKMTNVRAMAIYSANPTAQRTARLVHGDPAQSAYPYQLFLTKQEAIDWLRSHSNKP